jgi:hypothetical protein
MHIADEKIIELSKKKLLFVIAGSCLFVGIGLSLFQMDSADIASERRFNNPVLVHGLGFATFAFFGFIALCAIKKLFDSKPGLILDSVGITDNASIISAGLIPWPDITGFDIFETNGQRTLIVMVANPEKYIAASGPGMRTLHRLTFNMCGSPIGIASTVLKTDFDGLLQVCNSYFDKCRRQQLPGEL